MGKRGVALSMQTIVIAVLLLIVLFTIIIIFRTQIGNYSTGYMDIANKSIGQAKGELCQGILGVRHCDSACDFEKERKVEGTFSDCKGTKPVCCEAI